MRRAVLKMLAVAGLAALAGCGFQLRGQSPLPFEAAFIEAAPGSTLADQLRRHLDRQAKSAAQRDKADVIISLSKEVRDKAILSLSGAGKVREFRLTHTVTVAVAEPGGKVILAPSDIRLSRDFSYSDEQVLAKEAEETMLRRDMDDEALRQILRRLAFVKK